MTVKPDSIASALADLGTVTELTQLAHEDEPAKALKVNSHIHLPPNFSAFRDVQHAVGLAAGEGIGVLGVSNYYDYAVYNDFAALARENFIFPLFGLEIICLIEDLQRKGVKINDPGNPGKFYICGKGITRFEHMTSEAQRILQLIRDNDSSRMARMVKDLAAIFEKQGVSTGLDEAAVIERVVDRHGCARERVYLQERHVCQAFQERLFELVPSEQRREVLRRIMAAAPKATVDDAVAIQNEIRSHLLKAGKPAYVPETFIDFENAWGLIVELGGIPCYPTLADGADPICPFEAPVEGLIERLAERGFGCAEFIPIRNKPEVLTDYVLAMRRAGFVITAGTEHNTLDLLPMEPRCAGGVPLPEELRGIFWEGACVVAAHQFLSLHGEEGYEAGCGESRVKHLKNLGAEVIKKYQHSKGKI